MSHCRKTPGSNSSVVESAKDLNPFIVSAFKNIYSTLPIAVP